MTFLCLFSIFSSPVFAAPISAVTNKIIYATGDTLTIEGAVNTTGSTTLTVTIYNSEDSLMDTSSVTSSGSTPNTFSFSTIINSSYSPGNYYVSITHDADSVKIDFKVVSELIFLEPHLIGSDTTTVVSTDFAINTTAKEGYLGGNFTELRALSQSSPKTVFYGNKSVADKDYHFVVVDESYPGSYDTLYINDVPVFQMYNTSIQPPKVKKMGEGVRLNETEYVVGYIDFKTGNAVVLVKPISKSIYSPNDLVHFIVISKDADGRLVSDKALSVELLNSTEYQFNSTSGTTDSSGVFVSDFLAPDKVGRYVINVNDSLGLEFFSVESFNLYGKITDLEDNPTSTFAPNPLVRISATVKDTDENLINPSSISAIINYPNGTSQTVTLTGGNGTFSYNLNLAGSPQGSYGVRILATVGSDTQEFSTGFAIRSVTAEVMAINMEFVNEAQGPNAFVNAFAPNTNVTLLVVLSDISKGGFFAKGAEGEGAVDIDNATTGEDECNTSVSVVSVEDDRGVDITSTIGYQAMNLTNAISYIGMQEDGGEGPPPEMLRQCMIVLTVSNRTGVYRIKIDVKHGGDNFAGTTFGIQKYYATANPVDFTGEKDFWFYAPNSTIYIKLKVTDLTTRRELNASDITDAMILEMSREWPTFQDMLGGSYRPNESIVPEKGVISFTTPDSEGFFDFEFKFRTKGGEEGVGNGFFMLKKYMIWAEPVCQMEPCMFAPGKNIEMNVKIIPISKADRLDQGMTDLSQIGCGSTCNGFIASINSIWSDQLMKEIPASDYTVVNGTIFNSTANLTIAPGQNMPTGWFGVDLILTDSLTGDTYFGWAGFEIRRVMIITEGIEGEVNFTFKSGGATFGVGQPVLFGVTARNPEAPGEPPGTTPKSPHITSVSLESVRLMVNGPPVTLERYKDYNVSDIVKREVIKGPGDKEDYYFVNITGLNRTGNYQANVKVNTSNLGSDVWNYWFEMSSYFVELEYRGQYQWPPTFAPNENLMIDITGRNFDYTSHHLNVNGTKLRMGFDKLGNPKRLNSTVECISGSVNDCARINLTVDLSQFGTGEFEINIAINDTEGMQKEERIFFAIKSLSINVPNIDEFWIGATDTPTRELNLDNDRDQCDNRNNLQNDELSARGKDLYVGAVNDINALQDDTCGEENTKVCIFDSNLNFTISFTKDENTTATARCVSPEGDWTFVQEGGCPPGTNYIYIVSNSSHLWINESDSPENLVDMTNIEPIGEGDSFQATGLTYYVRKVGENWGCSESGCDWDFDKHGYVITGENFFKPVGYVSLFNCTEENTEKIYTSETYADNFAGIICILNESMSLPDHCENGEGVGSYSGQPLDWISGICPEGSGTTVYVASNKTHLWINTNPYLNGTSPLGESDSFVIGDRKWKVYSVGENGQGNPQDNLFNIMLDDRIRMCIGEGCGEELIFTVSAKYANNYANRFYIKNNQEWHTDFVSDSPIVYVVSNSSHLWINENSADMTSVSPLAETQTFSVNDIDWKIVDVSNNMFSVKKDGVICGEKENVTCQNQCQGPCNCPRIGYEITAPGEYSSNYHGYIRNLIDWNNADSWFSQPFNYSRPVYIYHNTTHVWMINDTDFSSAPMSGVNGEITDPYGGIWKVQLINKRNVKLEGQNVLAGTGAFINTSHSKSDNFKIERISEEQLGGWDQLTESQRGLDLDGDGFKNGTVYVAAADNAVTGVYDTFFFSTTSNFSDPIPITADRDTRTFGNNDQLTLLSMTSLTGVRVKAYSNNPSDWADLGEFKVGSNVTIPIIVKTPAGDDAVANVSINTIRFEPTNQPAQYLTPSSPPYAVISGIGEITVNLTDLGFDQTGHYAFAITAKNTSQEKLEEWKWPSATMRSFLVDTTVGKGGYVGTFYPLTLYRYDGENYNWMPEVEENSIQQINKNFTAIFANARDESACEYTAPDGVDDELDHWTLNIQNSDYWLYINSGNENEVWIKNGDCDFASSDPTNTNDQVNLTINNHVYMLYVLDINVTDQGSKGVVIGLSGVDKNTIQPLRYDNNRAKWRLMALNLSGTLYDVLLANDTAEYPMCSVWDIDECAKAAWFSTDGDFSGVLSTKIGENFTADLYLASIGSGSWEGVTIGNFSQIVSMYPNLPGIDVRPRDNTESYFANLDESVLNLDLNNDGDKSDTFYAVIYDDKEDSQSTLTKVVVDDDLKMTDGWWANFTGNSSLPEYYKDFYGNEGSDTRELDGNLPRGAWNGDIRFNESDDSWEISRYNITHMLLKKHRWPFGQNEDITLTMKVFEFDQSGMPDANITIEKVVKFTSNHYPVELTGYSVTGLNTTDSGGYAVLNLEKDSWAQGEYNIRIRVDASENRVELTDVWFRVE
jgi:hypothetical protein